MFGVWYKTGSTRCFRELGIRGDRQGLHSGKSEASRYGTHLLIAGSSFCQGAAQADYLKILPFGGIKNGRYEPSVFGFYNKNTPISTPPIINSPASVIQSPARDFFGSFSRSKRKVSSKSCAWIRCLSYMSLISISV